MFKVLEIHFLVAGITIAIIEMFIKIPPVFDLNCTECTCLPRIWIKKKMNIVNCDKILVLRE